MQTNKTDNNSLYDQFFLKNTFDSDSLKKSAQEEVDWIIQKTKVRKEDKILDVACGSGRHLLGFFNRGYIPYGVDFSSECVKLAKENCPLLSKNIYEDEFLNFSKSQKEKFDLLIVLGGSFGYGISENDTDIYLASLVNMMNLDGTLILQFLNKDWAQKRFERKTTFWNENAEHFILDQRIVEKNKLISEKIYISKTDNTQRRYKDAIFLFTKDEISSKIKNLGINFKNFDLCGNLSSAPFSQYDSPTPVVIVKN